MVMVLSVLRITYLSYRSYESEIGFRFDETFMQRSNSGVRVAILLLLNHRDGLEFGSRRLGRNGDRICLIPPFQRKDPPQTSSVSSPR